MPVSEARKAANARWDKENMAVLACRVTKPIATQFKAICERKGTNTNAVLLAYVKEFIRINSEEEAQEKS